MSATKGSIVRTIARMMGTGLTLGWVVAGGVSAADRGEACCKDLEERVSELEATTARTRPLVTVGKGDKDAKEKEEGLKLTIKGIVNHSILAWSDGFESNAYIVDSPQDGTAFTLEGEVGLGGGWKAGFLIGFDALVASSDTVDQNRPEGDGKVFKVSDSYWFISQEKLFGTIRLGLTDTATDSIDKINLADSDVVADTEVNNWIGAFFLRAASGELLTAVRWGDFIPKVAGDTTNVITYVSPKVKGFEASASWGRDDYWDAALRYSGKLAEVLKVKAGIGYYHNTSEEDVAALDLVDDKGWGASFAVRHIPTGVNVAINYGHLSHTRHCADPGVVSARCRGDDEFYYVKGGIIQKLFPWGNTAFYGEYYRGTRTFNDSDTDKVAALAFNESEALELRRSVATVWGAGVVQKIDDLEKKEKNGKKEKKENGADPQKQEEEEELKEEEVPIELYLGYRHYDLTVELLGEAGAAVPAKKLNEFEAIMTGARIRF